MKLEIIPCRNNFKTPVKGTPDSAAFDVYASFIEENNGSLLIGLGFKARIAKGYRAILVPRSSLFKKQGWFIPNGHGVIDSDYRGEWKMILSNVHGPISHLNNDKVNLGFPGTLVNVPYNIGDRVGQFYLEKEVLAEIQVLDHTPDDWKTARKGGFGSTGK